MSAVRYSVTVAGRTLVVELSADGAVVDGRTVDFDLVGADASHGHHLLVDGAGYDLLARPANRSGSWAISLGGRTFMVEVADERSRLLQEIVGATAVQVERSIRAPMPGLLVRVLVAAGDQVTAGQPVAVVEAMKMENELKAPTDGTIARIEVEAGQTVEKDALLIVLD